MADTISDFITIIRNASRVQKPTCRARYSKISMGIAKILKEDGFIRDFVQEKDENGKDSILITLKYVEEVCAITDIQRHSKPGRRLYYKYEDIPRVLGGLGTGILTTSRGLIRDREARSQKIGGELLCKVW